MKTDKPALALLTTIFSDAVVTEARGSHWSSGYDKMTVH